ncbi:MAG: hypothetical protein ACJ71Q_05020 [Terriglobales bacterium]
MPIRVGMAHGVVADVAVEVERLGVGYVGVGDGFWRGAPVG